MIICCVVSVSAVAAVILLLVTLDGVHQNNKCDLYKGRWVFDKSYPLYQNCPFIWPAFNCTGNGRPDLRYQKYRWKPNNCNLPSWDGRDFVNKVRGKRIMFVGDSLSRNQWLSLACMVYATYPNATYNSTTRKSLISAITSPELNLILLYQRNAFIVDILIQDGLRVLKLDSVGASSEQWRRADLLIFDTWHWWLYTGKKQQWNLIKDGNVTVKDMDRLEAYEKALQTWRRWVNENVDVEKVKIYFQGISPDHWNASYWNMPEMQHCGGNEEPLKQPVKEGDTSKADIILKEVLASMKKSVRLLDIRELSQLRVDGHPSIYGNHRHIGMDCTHWCLPGVPDTWNELIYATLLTK